MRALVLVLLCCACGDLTPVPGRDDADGGAAPGDGGVVVLPDGGVVVVLPDGGVVAGDGGTSGAPIADGEPCFVGAGAPCLPTSYCDSISCGAGRCKSRALASVNDQESPVCGCDGVTYWNALYATHAGVSVRTAGACQLDALACPGGGGCPAGTFCRLLTISTLCSAPTSQTCWAVPDACATSPAQMRTCGGGCVSHCQAIKAQAAFYYDAVKCP